MFVPDVPGRPSFWRIDPAIPTGPRPSCPLCRSDGTTLIGTLCTRDLAWAYRTYYGIDIAPDIGRVGVLRFLVCGQCDLRFFDPATPGSEGLYIQLQQYPWFYAASKPEYDVALRHVPADGRVLDVGCGRGAFGRLLAPSAHYVGLELNSDAVQDACRSGLDVRREDVRSHLDGGAGAYDAVVSFQVLEHVTEVAEFVQGCVDALRSGGLLCVAVPSADGFMGAVPNNVLNLPPHHLSWWSDRCLTAIADLYDLDLVELQPDTLQPEHFDVYLRHLVLSAARVSTRPTRLVDNRRVYRVLERATQPVVARLAPSLGDERLRPRGHSVSATYRKR